MEERKILQLPVEALRPNPRQPRRTFDPEGLAQLAESIRRRGVLQPLPVRQPGEGWELIAGERRLRAAKLAGLETVPCLAAEADEEESALLALMEHLQRQDLHYLEEAEALGAFLAAAAMPREEAARILGLSAPALSNKLRLLRLDGQCRELLVRHGLTERHARCLLRLTDPAERLAALKEMIRLGLNVARAEALVQRRLDRLGRQEPKGRRSYIIKDVRLFLNSLDRGIRLMREAGVDARTQRRDTEDAIELTVRIPRRQQKGNITGK